MTVFDRSRVVYVVDADASVREALARLLDAAGLAAQPCESIDTFLSDLVEDRIGCVVLDVSGPARQQSRLRARLRHEANSVPIIALSAEDDRETRRAARDLGARAFFRKPVDGTALLDSIAWLTRTESARDTR